MSIMYALVISGNDVARGEHITDFRGKEWVFEAVSRKPEPGKTGKVTVHAVNHPETQREFYPLVFEYKGCSSFIREGKA
jgi:hypothetical protein